MAPCQGCGSELGGTERFCRNCGAPVATLVADLVETHRFDPTNPDLKPPYEAPKSSTNPLFPGSPAAYPAVAGGAAVSTARLAGLGAFLRHLLQHKFAWVLIFVLISLFIVGGVTVGRRAARGRGAAVGEPARPPVEERVRRQLGLDPEKINDSEYPGIRGIFIESLTSDDSPAALANMWAGDVLMELNNLLVRNSTELGQVLGTLNPGDEVSAKLYRDGQLVTTKIKIADPAFALDPPRVEPRNQGFMGIEGTDRRRIAGTGFWGVQIRGVRGNGPADLAGLLAGDIIIEFDGHAIKTPQEFTRRIRATKPRSKVPVKFVRGPGEPLTIEMVVGHVD
jgi:S1-C subfamily serine protease